MSLVTVFFPKKESPFYRKAIVDKTEAEFFLRNGAKKLCIEATQFYNVKGKENESKS